MQANKDDTLANVGTTPSSGQVSKTTTFSTGGPNFNLPGETYKHVISYEVANMNLNSQTRAGTPILELQLDASISEELANYQYWTIDDLKLDVQCTSPLGTSSGAVLMSYMSDPINADCPTNPTLAKKKFGQTMPRILIRPRDNKSIDIDIHQSPMFGNWRFVKRGNSDDSAAVRQSSFGTIVALVNTSPAAADGANFTAWIHGTITAKGRTLVTQDAVARKISCLISGIKKSDLVQDELGWAMALQLQTFTTDFDRFDPVAQAMLKDSVWPVVTAGASFILEITLVDGDDTQTVTLETPTMYLSAVNGTTKTLYIPFPSHEEVYLLNPKVQTVTTLENQPIAVYLKQNVTSDSARNLAPACRRRFVRT